MIIMTRGVKKIFAFALNYFKVKSLSQVNKNLKHHCGPFFMMGTIKQENLIQFDIDLRYEYCNELKNQQLVNTKKDQLSYFIREGLPISGDFNSLKMEINQILKLTYWLTQARCYHNSVIIQSPNPSFNKIASLLALTLSQKVNQTYSSHEGDSVNNNLIDIFTYFEIQRAWISKLDSSVLAYYLNTSMHIHYDVAPLMFLKIYEIIKQTQQTQTQALIIQRSSYKIDKLMKRMHQNQQNHVSNQVSMSIYLSKIKLSSIKQKAFEEQLSEAFTLINYLQNHQPACSTNRIKLQVENIIYSLFLLLRKISILQQQGLALTYRIFYWLYQINLEYLASQSQNKLIFLLQNLNSHEDKLTCIRIDTCIMIQQSYVRINSLQSHKLNSSIKLFIQNFIQTTRAQIPLLNIRFWRYKYQLWLIDSAINYCPQLKIQQVHYFYQQVMTQQLSVLNKISYLTSLLQVLFERYQLHEQFIKINQETVCWLIRQTKQNLQTQKQSELNELLIYADYHPTLQSIFLPYLLKLLEFSLGHFQWSQLTKLYYFGLRWKAIDAKQQGKWNMEYVRRYILNEYVAMGIRRRQIPEDSYFYKILQQSTPQKFYQNYFQS